MLSTNRHNVPVLKVLLESLRIAAKNAGPYSTALSVPTAYFVGIFAVHQIFFFQANQLTEWIFWVAYKLAFVVFAVTCHRLILIGMPDNPFQVRFSARELKYVAALLVAVTALFCVYMILLTPLNVLLQGLYAFEFLKLENWVFYEEDINDFLQLAGSFLSLYFLARFSLVFPSTAIDRRFSLRESWVCTQGNGWRIAVTLWAFPVLVKLIQWETVTSDSPAMYKMLATLLFYVGLALAVFSLSLIYRTVVETGASDAVRA